LYSLTRCQEGFQSSGPRPYRVAVVSANFGGYDTVKEHPIKLADTVDWYYFTDNTNVKSDFWNVITRPYHLQNIDKNCSDGVNSPTRMLDSRTKNMMAAKFYKAKMHKIDILKGYDYYIWIDGSIILRDSFLEEVFSLFDSGYTLISFKHSKRTTVSDEIAESIAMPKYKTQDIEGQYRAYVIQGFKDDVGLFENTIMIRKNIPKNNAVFDEWWCHNVKYTYQDQISLPFCYWKVGTMPDYVIPENVFYNKRFSYVDFNQMKKHY
jgi:hypothetical protein